MLSIIKEKVGQMTWNNIIITRGDGITLTLPILLNTNGTVTEYTPDGTDVFALQVRKGQVTKNTPTPDLLFQGSLSVVSNKLTWAISSADTTQDCGEYYWDCQITQSGKPPFTFYSGRFIIIPEETIPTTP